VVALFIVGSLINTWFINPQKRSYLYIAWQAHQVAPSQLEDISDRLGVIVEDDDRYMVMVRSYTLTGDPQMDQAIFTRFSALISIGDLHVIIATYDELLGNASGQILKPLDGLVAYLEDTNPALHHEVENRLKTSTFTISNIHGETEITDAMAISLAGLPFFEEVGIESDDLYIVVVGGVYMYHEISQALAVMFQ